ncbi:uncharacterized protein LOC127240164 [Andrographis paniculata]|uniref:uncharacterized protein LOC127240164 n=1 Tax=Andrographis paniculata TaxID=175694 RepID=UPI0021E85DA8|nr:uncharacterized protein LOC127240164 [Andrographis paniculata]XP_051114625.1 uncharacterized protein LOC127240164 [Andrographis paniculata]XP_051114626.1 uncharacterized protein LOC127240164 [Andrographis paniculata]
MAQGTRTRTQKSSSVQLDYIINIEEIKPWPPTQSLRTLRAVQIQWEHGDRSSGLSSQVVPSLGAGTGVGDGRIEFNESFRLPVTLMRDVSVKRKTGHAFHKNCIDFNLYEPRRDKAVKGQLLGTAVLDLAALGVVKETLSVSIPINCKRTYWNAVQPLLYLKLQSVGRGRSNSTRESFVREDSLGQSNYDSVSVMSEEYAEEVEGAPFSTDDDISSHSSVGAGVISAVSESNGSSPSQLKKDGTSVNGAAGEAKTNKEQLSAALDTEKQQNSYNGKNGSEKEAECNQKDAVNGPKGDVHIEEPSTEKPNMPHNGTTEEKTTEEVQIYEEEISICEEKEQFPKNNLLNCDSEVDIQKQVSLDNSSLNNVKETSASCVSISNIDTSKNGKSVRSLGDSSWNHVSVQSNQCLPAQSSMSNECKDALKDSRSLLSDSKLQHLERRIKILEGELREAAAIEVGLYSVIAEHGSSMTKVHAPARRLVRSYFYASKLSSESRGSAAKSIVSGLVLVSKACGNDVPRLTFWLSNSIVLRVIMSTSFGDSKLPTADGPVIATEDNLNGKKKSSPLKWESFPKNGTKIYIEEGFGDWRNPVTFVAALEKIEAWIFSRIIESIWWQTFTPHMQPGNAEVIRSSLDAESNKTLQRTCSSIDQQQGNFSTELWKMAFRDAYEKICPLRAGGHDCSCLPVLSRVIMEQLVARLDVAMFNAILRESADEIPTDPVADPISDAKVLPIPAGKASFGAGAQLKTAIGNWSRWLTDLFGIDDSDDLVEDKSDLEITSDNEGTDQDAPSKSFRLLNALSDLMMLPKDLLLSQTVRKEVCPTFGPPIIATVLNSFSPDEFCPDPIPAVVLQALNSELAEEEDQGDGLVMNFPCGAAPIVYKPPAAVAVAAILQLGEFGGQSDQVVLRRSRSSVLKKSQTSDDELEELDSPLNSIIRGKASVENDNRSSGNTALRYKLLRDVWINCE